MANSSLGYTEPGSPNKRLFSRSFTEDAVTKDAQGIFVCDASGNIVSVTSNRLLVDASGVAVPVTDNSGSLTVDAPVGTPVFTRLSDGTSAIATLAVDTELPAAAALADLAANPTTPIAGAAMMLWDVAATGWVRQRSNSTQSWLSSAARTTTQTSGVFNNHTWRGLHLVVSVTSAGTGSITPKIMGHELLNVGTDYDLHAAATAITANGTYVYEVYPGAGTASGSVVQSTSRVVPRYYKAVMTHNNANSITYSAHILGIV